MSNKEHLEIIKLNNLLLAAKTISEKLRQGGHLGKKVGSGSEFEQYKHYEPGDDLKRLDWKLFARSEKYQIKESPVESNFHVRLMLDLSGSMNYEEDGIQRLMYAKTLLASLAYIAFQQGDILSLYFLRGGKVEQVVAESSKSFSAILYHLENAKAEGRWFYEPADFPQLKSKEKEIILIASDFLQHETEWQDIIKAMVHPKKEIIVFQLLGIQEIDLSFEGSIRFEDLESDEVIHGEGKALARAYNEAISKYLDQLQLKLQLPGVQYLKRDLHYPISELINDFLIKKHFT